MNFTEETFRNLKLGMALKEAREAARASCFIQATANRTPRKELHMIVAKLMTELYNQCGYSHLLIKVEDILLAFPVTEFREFSISVFPYTKDYNHRPKPCMAYFADMDVAGYTMVYGKLCEPIKTKVRQGLSLSLTVTFRDMMDTEQWKRKRVYCAELPA